MKNLCLTSVFLFLISCAPKNENSFAPQGQNESIIGGQEVIGRDPRLNSTVGIIMVDDRSGHPTGICTGTLIRPNVVLTAAHCLVSNDNSRYNFIIYFGNTLLDLSQFNSYRAGVKAVIHENFTNGLNKEAYDIGLIQFSGDVPPGFAPAPILKDDTFLQNKTELLVAGFGKSKRYGSGTEDGSGQLRRVLLKISDINFSDIEFRSSDLSRGICQGDSGGPAYVNYNNQIYLAGISNRVFGIGRFNCIYTSIFLRVDKFHNWIDQKINQM